LEKRGHHPRIRRTMATYIKVAYALLNEDCQTYGELLKRTGLSRRTLSKVLNELVIKGFLGKVVISRKKVYYVCTDPYGLELITKLEWHELGRPSRREYSRLRDKLGTTVEGVEAMGGLFFSLALSHPKAFIGVERDMVMLYLGRDNKILLDTEQFLKEIEKEYGVAFTNKDLFEGKWVGADVASEQVKAKAQLVEDHYSRAKKYFVPPILPKMNLGRCLEAVSRAYGLLIGSEKDFERWGIEVKRDNAGYYFENLGEVWEVKYLLRRAYNNYPRRETINKISALAYLLWLNGEKLRPYVTSEPVVI
jgi:DNA-binding HxlR family transcriptional regulator